MGMMKRISIARGAIWGAFTSLGAISLFFFGNDLARLPYLPFDFFDWLVRVTPAPLVNFGLGVMISLVRASQAGPTASVAKTAEQTMALLVFVLIGVIFGAILAWLSHRLEPAQLIRYGILGGGLLLVLAMVAEFGLGAIQTNLVISILWIAAVLCGWGAILGRLLRDAILQPEQAPKPYMSRRQFLLLTIAGVATLVLSALRISYLRTRTQVEHAIAGTGITPQPTQITVSTPDVGQTSGPAKSPPEVDLEKRIPPAPGTRPELTSNAQFYRVDINLEPPDVNGDTWRLVVDGLVQKPLSLSLADLRSRSSITEAITLECISNPVGGDLIGTTLYTGVPLKDILEEAGILPNVNQVAIEAADGYYESIFHEDLSNDTALLVYAMNGQPLPREHGFPLRLYIPNRHGMKLPKWITHMKAIDQEKPGYWVDRGWSNTAVPHTTSIIDVIDADKPDPQTKTIPTGGIAYAGGRGISRVEVQVDDGPWLPTELRIPPLSPLTWVQWRSSLNLTPGIHKVKVRAYDGTRAQQVATPADTFPNGATGVDEKTVLAG